MSSQQQLHFMRQPHAHAGERAKPSRNYYDGRLCAGECDYRAVDGILAHSDRQYPDNFEHRADASVIRI